MTHYVMSFCNLVVNKNLRVPFCSIGADHGLEQINHVKKGLGRTGGYIYIYIFFIVIYILFVFCM